MLRTILKFTSKITFFRSKFERIEAHAHKGGLEELIKDPYQMIKKIRGLSFRIVDDLAQAVGIERESPARIRAGCEHAKHFEYKFRSYLCVSK